ncbi:hypothetical protein AMTRI_Chr07g79820 [Amborella trichopoda]
MKFPRSAGEDRHFFFAVALDLHKNGQLDKGEDRTSILHSCGIGYVAQGDSCIAEFDDTNTTMARRSSQKNPSKGEKLTGQSSCSDGNTRNSRKERLRWTQDLRSCFEEAINKLGGADKFSKIDFIIDYSPTSLHSVACFDMVYGSKIERRRLSDILPNFGVASCAQITEALQLQLQVRRQLYGQLEGHNPLRMKLDAQGSYLDKLTSKNNIGIDHKFHGASSPEASSCIVEVSGINVDKLLSDSKVNESSQHHWVHNRLKPLDPILQPMPMVSKDHMEYNQLKILQPLVISKEDQYSDSNNDNGLWWSILASESPTSAQESANNVINSRENGYSQSLHHNHPSPNENSQGLHLEPRGEPSLHYFDIYSEVHSSLIRNPASYMEGPSLEDFRDTSAFPLGRNFLYYLG